MWGFNSEQAVHAEEFHASKEPEAYWQKPFLAGFSATFIVGSVPRKGWNMVGRVGFEPT